MELFNKRGRITLPYCVLLYENKEGAQGSVVTPVIEFPDGRHEPMGKEQFIELTQQIAFKLGAHTCIFVAEMWRAKCSQEERDRYNEVKDVPCAKESIVVSVESVDGFDLWFADIVRDEDGVRLADFQHEDFLRFSGLFTRILPARVAN